MKTTDYETKIETYNKHSSSGIVKNNTITDGNLITGNDRKMEEKIDEKYRNSNDNSKTQSHDDKQLQKENNNIDIHKSLNRYCVVNVFSYLSVATCN